MTEPPEPPDPNSAQPGEPANQPEQAATPTDQPQQAAAPVEQFILRLGDLKIPLMAGRQFTVGRETTCDLRLGHGSVSDVHCRLEVTDSQIIVHDLNSLGGTKIDGEPIADRPWAPGQILEVGVIRIELERGTLLGLAAAAANQHAVAYHRHEPSFGEIMASELRRTPWFALSVLIHGIVLLLLWVFCDKEVPLGHEAFTLSVEDSEPDDEVQNDEEFLEEIEPEKMEEVDVSEQELEAMEEIAVMEESDLPIYDDGDDDLGVLMTKVGAGVGDILKAGKGAISGSFRKTVAGMRKNGLEIVFVIDSTGSMNSVLSAAKARMAKMAASLLELVPHARIGVITYRDKGDDYVTKQITLTRDFYRGINFLQTIYAGGGGDPPEAVFEALHLAIGQKWGKTARRLVVLIGDAPPHKKTESRIANLVRRFAKNGRSSVHAIVTRPSSASKTSKDTERAFDSIARNGRGERLSFDDEGGILKAVMSLAFGRKERRSLDEIDRLVEKRRTKFKKRSQRVAAGEDMNELRRQFSKKVVPHDLVKAILAAPKKDVLLTLVGFAAKRTFNKPGRHAAAFILREVLEREEAPIDPETGAPMSRRRAKNVRIAIAQRFD